MERLLLKAATTATTDEGIFEAVISTATVDRDKDIVEPKAMVNALKKWADLGKLVPLAWAHGEEVVGHVDPATARIENNEVIAKGKVDQSTPRGPEAWRLVKSGTLSFSFGYLISEGGATRLAGGRFRIKELDVYEISVVPVGPSNNDTRVLSFKDAEQLRERVETAETTDDRLQAELQEVKARLDNLEKALETQKSRDAAQESKTARADDPLKEKARTLMLDVLGEGSKPPATVTQEQPPGPDMEPEELKRRSRDLFVQLLNE